MSRWWVLWRAIKNTWRWSIWPFFPKLAAISIMKSALWLLIWQHINSYVCATCCKKSICALAICYSMDKYPSPIFWWLRCVPSESKNWQVHQLQIDDSELVTSNTWARILHMRDCAVERSWRIRHVLVRLALKSCALNLLFIFGSLQCSQ